MINSIYITSFRTGITITLLLQISLKTVFADKMRLAIVIRNDLKLDRVELATQSVHTTISCVRQAIKTNPKEVKIWSMEGQGKIVLKPDASGEGAILELARKAKSLGLVTCINKLSDASQTISALGIGPAAVKKLEKVTGKLKLL